VELRPHADVVWRRLEDEVVLVQLRTNRIYSLNTTAARAWELLSEGLGRSEVERSLLEEYDVAPGELARSLDELLRDLSEAHLVTPGLSRR
jgi:hypothetical protein